MRDQDPTKSYDETEARTEPVSEHTSRTLGAASFLDTTHALAQDWSPARNRTDAPKNDDSHPAHLSDRLRSQQI